MGRIVSARRARRFLFFTVAAFVFAVFSGIPCAAHGADNDAGYTLTVKSSAITLRLPQVMLQAAGDFTRVLVPGMNRDAAVGAPLLPVQAVTYLVPQGKRLDRIEVAYSRKRTLAGTYIIEPRQRAYPLSYQGVITPTPPDQSIYLSAEPVPGALFSMGSPQYLRGHQLVTITLHPVEYVPLSGQVSYYEDLTLRVTLAQGQTPSHPLYRGLPQDREAVLRVVDNADAMSSYSPAKPTARSLLSYQYLIITTEEFRDAAALYRLQDLEAQKQASGLTTRILTVDGASGIYANYAGADNQEKIRNAIRDYYLTYETEYVLLAGDADGKGILDGETEASPIIPARGLYAEVNSGIESDANIPADIYYSNLDGTFNANANGRFGESDDDVDLFAEVYVGRAPVDSVAEVSNFVRKTIAYETSQGAYLTRAFMLGEKLDAVTYGKFYLEEIRLGSSAHGYTTQGMAGSGHFDIGTRYDYDGAWQTSDLEALMNSGVHVINHLGHANVTTFAKLFTNTNVQALYNTDYFFAYTQGCYSGSFDNRDCDDSYGNKDCVAEHLVVSPNGAFAVVANSRYGWYVYNDTDGLNQRFHRQFWDAIMGEGIMSLGAALADSKHDNAALINSDGMRWVYYTINLLGDPHTRLNAALLAPTEFSASNIAVGTSAWVTLRWKNSSRSDLTGTVIRYRSDGSYPTGPTDGFLLVSREAYPGEVETFTHASTQAGIEYHYVAFGSNALGEREGAQAILNRASLVALGTSAGSDDAGRSNCFVASVCYDDAQAPQVRRLRAFRDSTLLRFPSGQDAVKWYYMYGPNLAELVRENAVLLAAGRLGIDALVRMIAPGEGDGL